VAEKLIKFRLALIVFGLAATVLLSFSGINRERLAHRKVSGDSSTIPGLAPNATGSATPISTYANIYAQLRLENAGLEEAAFELALKGWEKLKAAHQLANGSLLSIADFSQPSTQKRLYILDMENHKLLYQTYVAHGRNSGKEQALNFSNMPSSNKSSPGFYRTENTYYGNNGFSLRLAGLERGINDNAESRAIVMHGADYVNEANIRNRGYLGRSQGCPAIPVKLTRPIINTIKNGSCLFIYAPITQYAQKSDLVR